MDRLASPARTVALLAVVLDLLTPLGALGQAPGPPEEEKKEAQEEPRQARKAAPGPPGTAQKAPQDAPRDAVDAPPAAGAPTTAEAPAGAARGAPPTPKPAHRTRAQRAGTGAPRPAVSQAVTHGQRMGAPTRRTAPRTAPTTAPKAGGPAAPSRADAAVAADRASGAGTDSNAAPPLTLHAPMGGRAIPLGDLGVLCSEAGPWRSLAGGTLLMPPPANSQPPGEVTHVRVAPRRRDCPGAGKAVELVATGPWPQVMERSVVLSVDEGRADATGRHLEGSVLLWVAGADRGQDICRGATPAKSSDKSSDKADQGCIWSTGRGVPADPDATRVGFYPAGSRLDARARFFDAEGRPLDAPTRLFKPARLVVQQLLPQEASVDLATGFGQLALPHPEAVASVSCQPFECSLEGGAVQIRASAAVLERVGIRLKLRPRVQVREGDRLRGALTGEVTVLHCPMQIVSGAPFRGNADAKVAVRVGGVCARQVPDLEFRANRTPLSLVELAHDEGGTLALLALGAVASGRVTLTAHRRDAGGAVVAAATSATQRTPNLRAVLEIPGFPRVDFLPTNRWTQVHAPSPNEDLQVVALPITGVYETRVQDDRSQVRGDPKAAGLTGLRLGLRSRTLPKALAKHPLAVVEDPLLRSVHEARVPASLLRGNDDKPLIELLCRKRDTDTLVAIPVGKTTQLPFGARDNCQLVFHRDRLSPAQGAQRLRLEIDVYTVGGGSRADARVAETITLSPGSEAHTAYIDGVVGPFDRLVVRVYHEADDTYYLGASEIKTGVPAAKWSVIFGTDVARLYATTAFPTGLYRVSDPDASGLLSLNFGLLSRLTWLDEEGDEGFLGLEAGLVVIGLGNAVTDSGQDLSQLGAVVGLGLSVPFANRATNVQAAINVHAWLEVDLTRNAASGADGRFAFIFGPSISIGNLGANL